MQRQTLVIHGVTHQRLDPQAINDYLADLSAEVMTQYDPCENEPQDDDIFPILDKEL